MYTEKSLVSIAKRDNNKKRNYLVVNRLQGKHIPVDPQAALLLFKALAEQVRKAYQEERLLVIGFAETATAIGSVAAIELGARYLQTTRENIPDAEYLFFSEEHSHAAEQKLVKNDMDRVMKEVDRILFIEDEITTGKTILNLIRVLKQSYGENLAFSAASLLNGMDGEALALYEKEGIRLHYVVKAEHEKYASIAEEFAEDGEYIPCDTKSGSVDELVAGGAKNPRRLIRAKEYDEACGHLWEQIRIRLQGERLKSVIVLGTEEFMYPALFVGSRLEQQGIKVLCHATTRSPIAVSKATNYPFHRRYELKSLYDPDRITYLYDLPTADLVMIITDADPVSMEGVYSLVNAVRWENENILLVRWGSDEKYV